MKYELLKRTAIALFVGSVISTYSVAEGSKLSENSSLKDVTNAINKNGENIKTISKLLTGDENDSANPGLIGTIDTINKQATDNANLLITMAGKVDQNKTDTDAELAKKADKTTVEQNTKEIEKIKNLEGYKSLAEVKAMVDDVKEYVDVVDSDVDELVEEHNSLAEKHNKLAEGVKKFTEEYNVFTNATNEELNKKADADDVEDALSRKANVSDVYTKTESDRKLDAKADKTELANKADKNSVYSKSETDNKFALKADNSVVSAQAVDINSLRTDVNAHTKRLDHLDNRVNKLDKDLKRGLAAQAALTGLFQPYTVGKANFTAAVGGYKSQTAVAVGTGYRYNQNIATKAGVAFTQGGGVTYNAGVNFEW